MDRYAPQEMIRFLRALDSELEAPTRVTVIGGAAIGLVYDSTHATTDIDLVPVGSPAFWAAAERATTHPDLTRRPWPRATVDPGPCAP